LLSHLDQPAEQQGWDIAVSISGAGLGFPLLGLVGTERPQKEVTRMQEA
jgi:hypothetical protein